MTSDFIIDVKCGIESSSPQISQYSSNFGSVKFLLDKNLSEYTVMIVSEIDGTVAITESDNINLIKSSDESNGNTILVWNIGKEITAKSGAVIYQIVAYKLLDNKIINRWYSKEGRLFVSESIDTVNLSTALIGAHPDLITRILLKVTSIDESLKNKVDRADGMGLSENNFSNAEKLKLAEIEENADVNLIETIKLNGKAVLPDSDKTVNIITPDYALKSYVDSLIDTKVDKSDEKVLSDNNYSDTEKTKLQEIESGAEVNKIEQIKFNDSYLPITDKTVSIASSVKNIDIISADGGFSYFDNITEGIYRYTCEDQIGSDDDIAFSTTSGYLFAMKYQDTYGGACYCQFDINGSGDVRYRTASAIGYWNNWRYTADKTQLSSKVDKVIGKGLSTNDYTDAEKSKLGEIESGAEVNKINTVKVDGVTANISDKTLSLDGGIKMLHPTAENISTFFDDITEPGIYRYEYSKFFEEYYEDHTFNGTLIVASDYYYIYPVYYQCLIDEYGIKFRKSDNQGTEWSPWDSYVSANNFLSKVRNVRPETSAALPATLAVNTIYDIGTQTTVNLKLPKGQLGDFIQVDFLSGSTAANVTVDATSCALSDFDLIPETDTIYSLYFDWGVLGYDSTNSKYIYGWRFANGEYTYSGGAV